MLHIALFEPCIAPNTGNVIRLSANLGCSLHLIEPLGFDMDEKKLRRAGLDYHEYSDIRRYKNFEAFQQWVGDKRLFACTTKATQFYTDVQFQPDDILLFGAETHGLSEAVHEQISADYKIRIPMVKASRSLNLANSVSIIAYEAARQLAFATLV